MIKATKDLDTNLAVFLNPFLETLNEYEVGGDTGDYLSDIEHALDKKDLVLCIGSGVTREFVGNWKELLNKLLVLRTYNVLENMPVDELKCSDSGITYALDKELVGMDQVKEYFEKALKNEFISDTVDVLEKGEYLMFDSDDTAPQIGDHTEIAYRETFFAEQVHYAIQAGILEMTKGKALDDFFIEDAKKDSTLSRLLKLCLKRKIQHIITYNFDTVFDRLLASEKVRAYFSADPVYCVKIYDYTQIDPILVLGDKHIKDPDKIVSIYHVHGTLDVERPVKNPIIFSENSYLSYQRNPLNWSNILLADLMSKYKTLCVGFSGTDSNFRMLVRFLTNRQENAIMGTANGVKEIYLMKTFGSELGKMADPDKVNISSTMTDLEREERMRYQVCAYTCVKTYFSLVNSYYKRQLGTTIVWAEDYSDAADQLDWLA